MLWNAFTPAIRPELKECPEPIIEFHTRLAAIEFFNTSQVIEVDLTPFDVVAEQGVYPLITGDSDTVVCSVSQLWYDGVNLKFIPLPQMRRYASHWPSESGDVEGFTQVTEDSITLYKKPVLDIANGIKIRACLRPSHTSTGIVDWAGSKFFDTIAYGAKSRLLSMIGTTWSDPKGAQMYAEMFAGSTLAAATAKVAASSRGALNIVSPGAV